MKDQITNPPITGYPNLVRHSHFGRMLFSHDAMNVCFNPDRRFGLVHSEMHCVSVWFYEP